MKVLMFTDPNIKDRHPLQVIADHIDESSDHDTLELNMGRLDFIEPNEIGTGLTLYFGDFYVELQEYDLQAIAAVMNSTETPGLLRKEIDEWLESNADYVDRLKTMPIKYIKEER